MSASISDFSSRRRGRPALMTREQTLDAIREIATQHDGLFRIHRRHADLYARARRLFGSWSAAVKSAGLDYDAAIGAARRRSRITIREAVRQAQVPER